MGDEVIHTEQIVLSGNQTTIGLVENANDVVRSITVELPDAQAAIRFQRSMLGEPAGLYNRSLNSCVTHCGDVLRAGGMLGVPERSIDVVRWLRSQ